MTSEVIGHRFGKLTVLDVASRNPKRYLCKCDCGNTLNVFACNLYSGRTQSCGCEHSIDGLSKTPLYNRYMQMKHTAGCTWTFQEFAQWVNCQEHRPYYRVMRIDTSKPFGADNCILK